jgi:hypothetical protein
MTPRRPLPISALLLPAFMALGQACNGDWSFNLPVLEGSPATQYSSACAAWARSFCQYQYLCDLPYFSWESVDQCAARQTLSCELIAADPNVVFDEERISHCTFPDDCTTPMPVCWGVGRAPGGSPCLWPEECQSGICGDSDPAESSQVCGVCGAEPGQPCASPSDCFSDSCVASPGGGQVCAPYARLGEPCGPGLPSCFQPDLELTCSSYVGEGGLCLEFRSFGQPCDSSVLCPSGPCPASAEARCPAAGKSGDPCGYGVSLCGDGLSCTTLGDAQAGVCTELDGGLTPLLSAYGAACSMNEDNCQGFGSCVAACSPPAQDGGFCCLPPAKDGEPCNVLLGEGCLPPAQCIASRCIFPTVGDCSP